MKIDPVLTPEEMTKLLSHGVDVELSQSILDAYNRGLAGRNEKVIPRGVPDIDGKRILDLRESESFLFSPEEIIDFTKNPTPDPAFLSETGKGKDIPKKSDQGWDSPSSTFCLWFSEWWIRYLLWRYKEEQGIQPRAL